MQTMTTWAPRATTNQNLLTRKEGKGQLVNAVGLNMNKVRRVQAIVNRQGKPVESAEKRSADKKYISEIGRKGGRAHKAEEGKRHPVSNRKAPVSFPGIIL